MSGKSKVLLVGSGGVGTIAAYVLESNGGADVTAVVRSDYENALATGYQIKSINYGEIDLFRPSHIVNTVENALEFGPFEYVVVCTKNQPDIVAIEDLIEPVVDADTCVVLIQNGLGIERAMHAKFPNHVILSGVQMISSTLFHMKVDHVGDDSMKIGVFDNGVSPILDQELVCKKFISLYSNSKNDCTFDSNAKYTRWRKLIYNATLNSTCAITNLDVGRVQSFGGIDTLIKPAMKEIIEIAKSDGVELDESIMDFMIDSDDGEWYAPSMLVDLRKGNYIEHEVIIGNALQIAKENKIDAPILTVLYNLLSLIQKRTKESKGVFTLPEKRPLEKLYI